MRRYTLPLLFLVAGPTLLSAQDIYANRRREDPAIAALSDTRRLALLPNETVGFRVLGGSEESRSIRMTSAHLKAGHLYHTVARIVPRDGSPSLRVEGTISADVPTIDVGVLPAGEYTVYVHLEDYATGATRDARNKVVLR